MSGPFGSSQWMYSSGAGSFYPEVIDQSVRLDSASTAYFTRTPSSAGNRQNWTISMWVKRSNLEGNASNEVQYLFAAVQDNNNYCGAFIDTDNTLYFRQVSGGGVEFYVRPAMLFRDPSAWYHLVFQSNTTNGTASDRVKIYVNGERVTAFNGTSYPSQNANWFWNNTYAHAISNYTTFSRSFDGYMADVYAVDGSALTADSFGEYKSGVWVPKAYSGSYGTNGFHLEFANSGSLGADTSGNGNNWTANNLAATDQVLDSPTNNFATVNALELRTSPQEGNLKVVGQADACPTFHIPTTGKWYAEFVPTAIGNNTHFGFTRADKNALNHSEIDSFRMVVPQGGSLYLDGTGLSSPQSASGYSAGNILSLAIDMDNGHAYWRANNSIIASLTNQAVIRDNRWKFLTYMNGTNDAFVHNYGQDSSFAGNKTAQGNTDANGQGDFYYAPPSGYLALCSANLPVAEGVDPAEDNSPQDYFNTVLWTGNGSSQSITGVGFQPDWVWIKERSSTSSHAAFDIVRGVQKRIIPDTSAGEDTNASLLTAFNSDGFSVGSDGSLNQSSQTYVGWNWKAGGSAVTNTTGSITTNVSASPSSGFAALTFTGNGTSGATLGHGLGIAPAMVIVKKRSGGASWRVQHQYLGPTKRLYFDETGGAVTSSSQWNNTAPTSSVITIGNDTGVNENGQTFVCYAFAEVDGFSKFDGYIGNGSSDGVFVYTGFRPAFVIVKKTNASGEWVVWDDKRSGYNVDNDFLYPNASNSEFNGSTYVRLDLVSNGFKMRDNSADTNGSGNTYIYMAFAQNPFKYANAR